MADLADEDSLLHAPPLGSNPESPAGRNCAIRTAHPSDDAREKLQYDLYYLKNHSILLDLIILIQTVDVVLVGDGAR